MKRIIYFDLLRIIAICAVVLIHTSARFLSDYNEDPSYFYIGNFYDSISRWCVPVFIMVSGALLLRGRKEEPLWDFFRKRTNKVIVPFIAWSMIYVIFRHYHDNHVFTYEGVIKDFLDDNIYFHLWFLYMIIGLYLITPIFRTYVNNARRGNIFYFIVLWFISSFIPIFNNVLDLNIHYIFQTVSGYIGFFILGYYLYNFDIKRNKRILIYLLSLISLLVTYFGTAYLSITDNGDYNGTLYNYIRPNIILIASAIFLFFKEIKFNEKKVKRNKIIFLLSNVSFGVYLVHVMIRDLLVGYIDMSANPIVDIPLVTVGTLIISFIIAIILSKIPIVRRLVP